MRSTTSSPAPRALSRWLLIVAAMVFLMVVVGGITRLTESGLSMTRWEPISGAIPPLTDQAWTAEFEAYKATPEYRKINSGMDLAGFKRIFFWEYLHRLIARTIGLAFALPLLWFWWRRKIPADQGPRLVALLALGGLQGAIGWWMVASGLIDRPDVSHIRLAVHLLMALFIFSLLIWTALELRDGRRRARFGLVSLALILVLAIQIMLGAFTAGLDAGYAYASWPKMGDTWFPEGGWHQGWSLARNAVDNPVVVQFIHRWFAWIAAAAVVTMAARANARGAKGVAHALATLVLVQIGLGIATLLTGVDIVIAVAHQAVAALLLATMVLAAHRIGRRPR